MGNLTVSAVFKKFPMMSENEMASLVGSRHYNDHSIITPGMVAGYHGAYSQPLSNIYAKNNPNGFIPLLGENNQKKVMQQAHVNPEKVTALKEKTKTNNNDYRHFGSNDMNKSIFDIEKERRKKMPLG